MMERFSSGYRFDPSDLILVWDYLRLKCNGDDNRLPSQAVQTADVYAQEPWILTGSGSHESAKMVGARYFFSTRKKRRDDGLACSEGTAVPIEGHLNRPAGQGKWRLSRGDIKRISDAKAVVGQKRSYTYFNFNNVRTHWLMDEYEMVEAASKTWVLCRIKCNRKVNDLGDEEDVHNQLPDYHESPPTGYVFKPTPSELLNYLDRKIKGLQLPSNLIENGDVYKKEPWILTGANDPDGIIDEKYYLTTMTQLPERKGQMKMNRRAGSGRWKKWGSPKTLSCNHECLIVKMFKFKYFPITDKNMQRTEWFMDEFTLTSYDTEVKEQFQEMAVCRIYNREKGENRELPAKEVESQGTTMLSPIEGTVSHIDNATANWVQAPAMGGQQAIGDVNHATGCEGDGAFTKQAVANWNVDDYVKMVLKEDIDSAEAESGEEDLEMWLAKDYITTAEMLNIPATELQSQEQVWKLSSNFNQEYKDNRIEQAVDNIDNATANWVQAPDISVGEETAVINHATRFEGDDDVFTEQAVHNSNVELWPDNITTSTSDGVQVPAMEELTSDEFFDSFNLLKEEDITLDFYRSAIDNDIAMWQAEDNITTAEMQNVSATELQSQVRGCQVPSDLNKEVTDKSGERP